MSKTYLLIGIGIGIRPLFGHITSPIYAKPNAISFPTSIAIFRLLTHTSRVTDLYLSEIYISFLFFLKKKKNIGIALSMQSQKIFNEEAHM